MKYSCAVNEVSATLAGMAPPALLGAKHLNRIARGRLEFGALGHLSFAEAIGAFYATGGLMLVLGATGWVKRAMHAVPMPIVMGMVAGVFLRFGLDLIRSLHDDAAIVAPMIVVWLLLTALPGLGRRMPPLIGALLVGMRAINPVLDRCAVV